jgi:hypothetical protein
MGDDSLGVCPSCVTGLHPECRRFGAAIAPGPTVTLDRTSGCRWCSGREATRKPWRASSVHGDGSARPGRQGFPAGGLRPALTALPGNPQGVEGLTRGRLRRGVSGEW